MIIQGTFSFNMTKMTTATDLKNLIMANFPEFELVSDTGSESSRLIKFRVPCTNHYFTIYTNYSNVGVGFRKFDDSGNLKTNDLFGSGAFNYTIIKNDNSGAFLTDIYLSERAFVYSKVAGDIGMFSFGIYNYASNSDTELASMNDSQCNVRLARQTSDGKEVFLPAFCPDDTDGFVQKAPLSDILAFTNKQQYSAGTKLTINGNTYVVLYNHSSSGTPNLIMKG